MPGIRPAPRLSLLGLTALRLLHERPMHPYEMARLIRERRIDEVLQLKRGSLYHAVERLARDGLVEAAETCREGRRPERTVYRLTEAGRDEFEARLRALTSDVVYEPTRFTAAVQFLSSLPPSDALRLLELRLVGLEELVARFEAVLRAGLERVHVLEVEYARSLAAAELEWVRGVAADLRSGRLRWGDEAAPPPPFRLVEGEERP
jgi:DNA-binding PadR family transcriptional regulator